MHCTLSQLHLVYTEHSACQILLQHSQRLCFRYPA